ncbi:MAG: hypothetical protein WC982_05275 [Advenella sp.]
MSLPFADSTRGHDVPVPLGRGYGRRVRDSAALDRGVEPDAPEQ